MPRRTGSNSRRFRNKRRGRPSGRSYGVTSTPRTLTDFVYTGKISPGGVLALSADLNPTNLSKVLSVRGQIVSEKPSRLQITLRGAEPEAMSAVSPIYTTSVIPRFVNVRNRRNVEPMETGKEVDRYKLGWLYNIGDEEIQYTFVFKHITIAQVGLTSSRASAPAVALPLN